MSDAELVARARAGDRAAFGELVDRHRAAVFRAAMAALGSAEDAAEAAQDAFVRAYFRLDRFRGESSFKTWLLAIAWRTALTARRRRAFRLARLAELAGLASRDPPVERSPEEAAVGSELVAHVRRLVRALPAKLRDPLLLAAAGELTYDEIGAMLDVPVGTVKWRVAEARRRVKARLDRLGL